MKVKEVKRKEMSENKKTTKEQNLKKREISANLCITEGQTDQTLKEQLRY